MSTLEPLRRESPHTPVRMSSVEGIVSPHASSQPQAVVPSTLSHVANAAYQPDARVPPVTTKITTTFSDALDAEASTDPVALHQLKLRKSIVDAARRRSSHLVMLTARRKSSRLDFPLSSKESSELVRETMSGTGSASPVTPRRSIAKRFLRSVTEGTSVDEPASISVRGPSVSEPSMRSQATSSSSVAEEDLNDQLALDFGRLSYGSERQQTTQSATDEEIRRRSNSGVF